MPAALVKNDEIRATFTSCVVTASRPRHQVSSKSRREQNTVRILSAFDCSKLSLMGRRQR
eukprot:scaffold174618_cov46-Prasinocladus_malaysianus.AAC.1